MINTPNHELEESLQAWTSSKHGADFLFANEHSPRSVRIATDQVGVRPGHILVVGGARSIADVTTISEQPVTGMVQIDRSPMVVLQVRFMVELAKRAPTRDAFAGVLADVMFGDNMLNPDHQRESLDKALAKHGVERIDPEIAHLFEEYLATSRDYRDIWNTRHTPLSSSYAGTAFRSDEAFAKVKELAQKDRLATIVVDLNDPESTKDLDARLKVFGEGVGPAVADVSNAHWERFTGQSSALCDLVRDMAKEDKSSVVVFTDNMGSYSKEIANSKKGGTGAWTYYASKPSFIVENEVFASCRTKTNK